MYNLIKTYFHKVAGPERHHSDVAAEESASPVKKTTITFEDLKEKIGVPGSDNASFAQKMLSVLAKEMEISQGIFFVVEKNDGNEVLRFLSGYAYDKEPGDIPAIEFGEGFPGQVAKDRKAMIITDVPQGYLSIVSGLGKATPASLIIFPVINGKDVVAVVELASFHRFTDADEALLMKISSWLATFFKKPGSKK